MDIAKGPAVPPALRPGYEDVGGVVAVEVIWGGKGCWDAFFVRPGTGDLFYFDWGNLTLAGTRAPMVAAAIERLGPRAAAEAAAAGIDLASELDRRLLRAAEAAARAAAERADRDGRRAREGQAARAAAEAAATERAAVSAREAAEAAA